MQQLEIPPWCKPNGWAFHLPDRVVFQSLQLQRNSSSNIYYLKDCNGADYPLTDCQELSQSHLKQPATLIINGGNVELLPHPKGVAIRHSPKTKRLIIAIPDEGDRAAQSLARIFNGAITTTNTYST